MSHKQSKKIRKLLNYRHGNTATELKHRRSVGRLGWTEAITTLLRKLLNYLRGDTATELKHHQSMGRLGCTEAVTTPLRKLYQQMKRKQAITSHNRMTPAQ